MNVVCSMSILSIVWSALVTEYLLVTVYLQYSVQVPTTTIFGWLSSSIPDSETITYSGDFPFNETFSEQILRLHNEKRSLHGAQTMSWNASLFEYASRFAMDYDCSGVLKHSGGPYGENLALGYTVEGAIEAWYEEGETYDYQSHNEYNHFTQMIWNSSSQLGCATKHCNSIWNDYVVCSYYQQGNVVGYSPSNVFPLH
ncbi:probable pathogenesis-related protein CaO19.2336 [[Candida] jaroonii]|uniref:Probable pathogenesis-related protein CaO19.2336 n=1 Tax=[Candida] jaroonii TaxID=467808 RepID=A0ACA9Y7A2_9ASCO|nr:probable pathogenesis-related protein CaO19.2336 [[Candida] jaroonii]